MADETTSPMAEETTNRFRRARGRVLREHMAGVEQALGRPLRVLDVGGRADYWDNVGLDHIEHITLMNYEHYELGRDAEGDTSAFTEVIGDARDMSQYADDEFDLVHANSVIEHVGGWPDMERMAAETRRVGKAGWIQTPAYGFPIEPHYKAPFMHWFGAPAQRVLFSISARRDYRAMDLAERREEIDGINLLTRKEFEALYPGVPMYVERLILAKSFSAYWGPGTAA